jgi:PAS domain S-box-containing protein
MKGPVETVVSFPEDCFVGGGQMGELMRSLDWSKTTIGAVETWSPAFRMMVRILLANRFPMVLWWGPHYCQLYNDSYRPMLGKKHPQSMGQPACECFAEIWATIGPLIDTAFNGGSATWMDDLELEYLRSDRLEEAHFTFAYSPVPDESMPSGIGGVLGTVQEITVQVLGERRGLALRELGARSGEAKTAEEACMIAATTLSQYPKDMPFVLIYLLDGDRKQAHLAGTAGFEMGEVQSQHLIDLSEECSPAAIWPLGETVRSETMQIVENLQSRLPSVPPGPWSDPPRSAVVWPIRSDVAHQLVGLLVVGVSSRLHFDDRYRDFFGLVTSQVASAVSYARAYETERKRAEALAEIDRAKTAFFSNVSHEFRTPLTLMLGPLEEELRENGKGRARVEIAYRNSLRLLKLVNTLLDFSRIEAERTDAVYEPTDLAATTAELASVFRSAIEKAGLRLIVDAPPLPEEVNVDREMWEKIVLNLLSNAFKFTFEGEIKVSLGWCRDHVELSVRDTGIGIPAPELSHIFARFHRVRGTRSRTHEGTGIGLSLVQELVKMQGGEIQVQSVEGQGSVFTVSIPTGHAHLPKERLNGTRSLVSTRLNATPFVEEALLWSQSNTSSSASHPGELGLTISSTPSASRAPSVRILFADDNADMRNYVWRLLEELYEVETVDDGQAALESILANPPDLVLTDVMMPRLDGFGLLRALRADERTRTLPLIMLSARAGEEARVEGLIAGVDDYLIKPFSARELLARIGTLLEMTRLRRVAATALEESEKRLREMADHAPVMIWITDDHGNVEFVNRTYLQYFEVTLADVAGQQWKNLVHPGDLESYSQQLLAASAARRSFRAEARIRRGDGKWRWVDSWAVPRSPERDSAPGMVGCSTDITQAKEAENALQQANAQLNVLSRRLFAVQEDERRHLSRELHDRMGQALTAVKIDLQCTQCLVEHTEIVRRLDDSIGALELLVQQARQLSLELRPPLLDDLGLVPALRWYLDQQAQRAGFHVKFFADQSLERFDVSLETACFRVAQEALTNIIRHAHAQEVNVELHRTTKTLHLVVRDDGIGFDVATAQQHGRQGASLGLLGMLERVALVGGEWDCKSAPGSGTEVHAFLPLLASDPQEPRP